MPPGGVDRVSLGCCASAVTRFARVSDESSSRAPAAASSNDRLTSSLSRARAPTRRASAETRRLLRLGGLLVGPVGLDGGQGPGDQGEDEEDGGAAQRDPEPTDQPGLDPRPLDDALLLGLGVVGGRLEELPFDHGQGGALVGAPVERPGQPDAAVELAVGTAESLPRVGGGREVVTGPLTLDVVVEPAPEPGPGPGEGFVGDLEGAVVAGDQPGGDQHLDELLVLGVGADQAPRHPGADRFALGSRRDQAEDEVAQQVSLLHRDP